MAAGDGLTQDRAERTMSSRTMAICSPVWPEESWASLSEPSPLNSTLMTLPPFMESLSAVALTTVSPVMVVEAARERYIGR